MKGKRITIFILICSSIFCIIVYNIYLIGLSGEQYKDVLYLDLSANRAEQSAKKFSILMWTNWFGGHSWLKFNQRLNCQYSNCILTNDRTTLNRSDGVMFHWWDTDIDDLPTYHSTNQKWIIFSMESPQYSPDWNVDQLFAQINWTMSYRLDSDIIASYGRVVKYSDQNKLSDPYKPKFSLSSKTKSVAWIVSNCHAESKREQYVNELKKYIDVDIYGSCAFLWGILKKCDDTCLEMIEGQYKFYLAFENSVSKQ